MMNPRCKTDDKECGFREDGRCKILLEGLKNCPFRKTKERILDDYKKYPPKTGDEIDLRLGAIGRETR